MGELNDGHQIEFLTAVSIIGTLIDDIFGRESFQELKTLNPKIAFMADIIEENIGNLYQAIGNAKPWNDE